LSTDSTTARLAEKPATLIEATGIVKTFETRGWKRSVVRGLDGVSLTIHEGETVALVGESGSGKSTFGRCLMRLYDIDDGQILFKGNDISRLKQRALRPFRREMQMVFQDPGASLNPRRRIGRIIADTIRGADGLDRRETENRVGELLGLVGMRASDSTKFSHEFSGGQRQRIGIARAIGLKPSLIVADEPVSSLDVSVQAQIVNLFLDLQEMMGVAYLFISHDLGVVRQIADTVAVLYLGQIVEKGPVDEIFLNPRHPYTEALIAAAPSFRTKGRDRAHILPGDLPHPSVVPSGCAFRARCPRAVPRCAETVPLPRVVGDAHTASCHLV
jgi:oligopeptide/dipeptide ABC transporter ATP-binding protein